MEELNFTKCDGHVFRTTKARQSNQQIVWNATRVALRSATEGAIFRILGRFGPCTGELTLPEDAYFSKKTVCKFWLTAILVNKLYTEVWYATPMQQWWDSFRHRATFAVFGGIYRDDVMPKYAHLVLPKLTPSYSGRLDRSVKKIRFFLRTPEWPPRELLSGSADCIFGLEYKD
jgi:hypothetical protein